jgi:hypothetical protein
MLSDNENRLGLLHHLSVYLSVIFTIICRTLCNMIVFGMCFVRETIVNQCVPSVVLQNNNVYTVEVYLTMCMKNAYMEVYKCSRSFKYLHLVCESDN